MKKIIGLAVIFLGIVALTGCGQKIFTQESNPSSTQKNDVLCDKEKNCCVKNDDCQYIWFTGGCNTSEYVAKAQKEAEAQGRINGEAPQRDNVTCTCENKKCVTHN